MVNSIVPINGMSPIVAEMAKSRVPINRTSPKMLEVVNQALGEVKPGSKFIGELPNIEGKIYALGNNRGVYHYVSEYNFGYFTSPETNKIVGYVFPNNEKQLSIYERKNGDISTDIFDSITCNYQMVVRDKNGNLKNLYTHIDGEENYLYPRSNLYTD